MCKPLSKSINLASQIDDIIQTDNIRRVSTASIPGAKTTNIVKIFKGVSCVTEGAVIPINRCNRLRPGILIGRVPIDLVVWNLMDTQIVNKELLRPRGMDNDPP